MKLALTVGAILLTLGGCVSANKTLTAAELDEMRNYHPSRTSIYGVVWAAFNDSCLPYYGEDEFGIEEFRKKLNAITGGEDVSGLRAVKSKFGDDAQFWRISSPRGDVDIGITEKKPNACIALPAKFNKTDMEKLLQHVDDDPRYHMLQKCLLTSEVGAPIEIQIFENHLYKNVSVISTITETKSGSIQGIFALPQEEKNDFHYLIDQCMARIS